MDPTISASDPAVVRTSMTDEVQTSEQDSFTGFGLPVGRRQRRSCIGPHLRKTKLCMFYPTGACQYGDNCVFAHTVAELQSLPDLNKTRLCTASKEGVCYNKDCGFAHSEEELRTTNLFHKKTLCIWNEKGKCKNGDGCRFAHGTSELRKKQGGKQLQSSHAAKPASCKQLAAEGVKILKEPMKVPVNRQAAPEPAALPATLLADAAEPWPSHCSAVLNATPCMPGAGFEGMQADLDRRGHNVLSEGIMSDFERIREDAVSLAPKYSEIQKHVEMTSLTSSYFAGAYLEASCRIREYAASLAPKYNEIQKHMEMTSLTSSYLAGAYLEDANPATIGMHLKVEPGLLLDLDGGEDSRLPMYLRNLADPKAWPTPGTTGS